MDTRDKDRFFTMAETYDQMAPMLVPQYDFLQNQAIDICHLMVARKKLLSIWEQVADECSKKY